MRKLSILALVTIAMTYNTFAQVNPHAIGVRLGGGTVNGAEISYQHGLSSANRFEIDAGFGSNKHHNRLYLAGMYHWDLNIVDRLNWYIGPGASIGFYSYDDADNSVNAAIGGQIGIEYDFGGQNVPILLSLDVRPMWDLLGNTTGLGYGFALGVRYIW
jgi:hypothetical protein